MATHLTDVRDLYGLALDRFVTERGALAKSLRAAGDREQAAKVAGRRKPSVAAWTVNQLVRAESRAVTSLFGAGDALLRAQADLLEGRGDRRALRDAAERERAVVDDLIGVARGLLSSAGHELTQATLDRVSATLHAAGLDEDAREQVRDGCLERDLRYVGFGATETAVGAAGSRAQAPRADPNGAEQKRGERERGERERAERLNRARQAEAGARRVAKRADHELEAAQERRDLAAGALVAADDALAAACERATDAKREHRRAQHALERADKP